MTPDPTPEQQGRSIALREAVARMEVLADQPQVDAPGLDDESRRYLRSFIDTCRSIADRLRRSPGYEP